MSKGCLAALVLVLLSLIFLYQVIIMALVLPINIECPFNGTIPPRPAVNLSMDEWIQGGQIASCIVFGFMCFSGKRSSSNDCLVVFNILLYLLYNVFSFIWSLIGLAIYNDYYQ